jgi:segregation and condensation protein B
MSQMDPENKTKFESDNTQEDMEAVAAESPSELSPLERILENVEMAAEGMDFIDSESESADELEPAEFGAQSIAQSSSVEALNISEHDEDEDSQQELIQDESEPEEFVDHNQALSIIESLLFSSDRPLTMGTFKTVFQGTQFKTKDIKKALESMQAVYADPARGVSLEEINGGWQLRTKVDNMDFLRRLAKARPFKLSGPALEVLSIVAYKQPIVKSEVDEIRGVESGHLIRALMEKGLVNFQGKSELPGKPMQYGTTRKFLEIFGLRNLRELPSLDEIDQLLPDGIGMEEDDEKLSDVTAKMSEDYHGNYSEGEEELMKIEETLGDIDTSSEFFEQEKQRQKEKRDRDRAQDIREAMDVGEDVDEKDVRWLARYEEQIAQAEAAQSEVQDEGQVSEQELAQSSGREPSTEGENLMMASSEELDLAQHEVDNELESALFAEEESEEPTQDFEPKNHLE